MTTGNDSLMATVKMGSGYCRAASLPGQEKDPKEVYLEMQLALRAKVAVISACARAHARSCVRIHARTHA
jgi:hypothetical protein